MTKGVMTKLNRPQLDALIFEIIRPMKHEDAKALILKKYQKAYFSKLTLDEMQDFVNSFSKPETNSQNSESHPRK
jgi:hypothetical protein